MLYCLLCKRSFALLRMTGIGLGTEIRFACMRRFQTIIGRLASPNFLALFLSLSCVKLAAQAPRQPGRPRITGIDHVTIYVGDLAKSKQFYSEILGLAEGCPEYTGPETCYVVAPSEQRLLLKLAPAEIRSDPHKS